MLFPLPYSSATFGSSCWYVFIYYPLLASRIFLRYFGISCFVCVVFSYLNIFLVFHLSPLLSNLSHVVLFVFFAALLFFFSSQHFPAIFLFLSIFPGRRFLISFPVLFPLQVLYFFLCSLGER